MPRELPQKAPGFRQTPLDDAGREKGRKPCWARTFRPSLDFVRLVCGGEEEDRTPDLRIANATLSQLSYPPNVKTILAQAFCVWTSPRRGKTRGQTGR